LGKGDGGIRLTRAKEGKRMENGEIRGERVY